MNSVEHPSEYRCVIKRYWKHQHSICSVNYKNITYMILSSIHSYLQIKGTKTHDNISICYKEVKYGGEGLYTH